MGGRLRERDTSIKFKVQSSKFRTVSPLTSHVSRCLLPFAYCLLLFGCGTPYGIYHRVESGQTLNSIAKTYNVSPQEILRINRLREPVNLKEGDAVFIPGASVEKIVEAHKDDVIPTKPIEPKKRPSVASIPPSKEAAKPDKGRFIWPLEGKLISEFGIRNGEKHAGIDIKANEGTPIKAADSGKVIYSGNGLNGYGNLIIIKHEGTFFTVYAHNKKNLVNEGSLVEKGEVIAEVGNTGNATTPHLHFEIRKNKVSTDPIFYLP